MAHASLGEIAGGAEAVRGRIEDLAFAPVPAAADEDAAVVEPRGGEAGVAVDHRARLREGAVLVEFRAPAAAGDENPSVGQEDRRVRPARNRHRAGADEGKAEDEKGCGEVHRIADTERPKRTSARGKVAPAMTGAKYKRVLLKLSGEALMGERRYGIDPDTLAAIADEIVEVQKMGIEIAVVIGGGNIFRGVSGATEGIDRVAGDHMGMLATVINALALQDSLERRGAHTRVTSAITMPEVAEPFIRRRAIRHLEKQRIVICAAGTGNPFFTTDSAAALRASELNCQIIFKATQVDGIYTSDPKKDPAAQRLPYVTYQRVLADGLQVMDASAIDLARGSSIPIYIFSLREPGNIKRALLGEDIGSIVSDEVPAA